MPVEADKTYEATVKSACLTCSSKGTLGVAITYKTGCGEVEGTIWITPNTIERAKESLETLGADPEKLSSRDYMEDIGAVIGGSKCEIVTEDNEYKGKHYVKVKWVNASKSEHATGGNLSGRVAHLFGGPKPIPPSPPPAPPKLDVSDDDVPF